MTTTDLTLIIPSTETVDNGYTRGWIVPAGTETTADLELEAVDHIDIPATEDEAQWWQGLRDAAAHDGWAIEEIVADGVTVIASVVKS